MRATQAKEAELTVVKVPVKLQQLADGRYAVEVRERGAHRTAGRVLRVGRQWQGLGVGAHAWTPLLATRREVVAWLVTRVTRPADAALLAQVWAASVDSATNAVWSWGMRKEAEALSRAGKAAA